MYVTPMNSVRPFPFLWFMEDLKPVHTAQLCKNRRFPTARHTHCGDQATLAIVASRQMILRTKILPGAFYTHLSKSTPQLIHMPRVSLHGFRHSNATIIGDTGESLKTTQAILGHSDLETKLNTYMPVIPDSQR
jgi:integrase